MGALLQGLGSLLGGEQKTGNSQFTTKRESKATKPKKVSSDRPKSREVCLKLNLKNALTMNLVKSSRNLVV